MLSVWQQVVVLLFHQKPNTAHRYIYLSCFRGSVFRLNIGLAEGEERGLMDDRKENAQQTQREKVLEMEILQNRGQLPDSSPMKLIRKLKWGGWCHSPQKLWLQMLLSFPRRHSRHITQSTCQDGIRYNDHNYCVIDWGRHGILFLRSNADRKANKEWRLVTTDALCIISALDSIKKELMSELCRI